MSKAQETRDCDPPHTEEDKRRIVAVERAYFQKGTKLFDREILKKISKISADYRAGKYEGRPPPTLEIPDFVDGNKKPYTINLDLGIHGDQLHSLEYLPIQTLINPYWYRQRWQSDNVPNPIRIDVHTAFAVEGEGNPSSEEFKEFEALRKKVCERWKSQKESQKVWKSIRGRFRDIWVKNRLRRVTKVIAFGNGTPWHVFRMYREDYPNLARIITQHIVVAEIRAYIERKFKRKVRAYAQDPQYSPQDVQECLQPLGIELLEDPNGALEIDDETLVFAINPNLPLLQLIADISPAVPPLILHETIKRNEDWQLYKSAKVFPNGKKIPKFGTEINATSPRVERFIRQYKEYSVHDPDQQLGGNRTELYVLEA